MLRFKKKSSLVFLFAFLLFAGYLIWPFISFPPSHRTDQRTLWLIRAMTPRLIPEGSELIEGLSGPVILDKVTQESETSGPPFIWQTSPKTGGKIPFLEMQTGKRKESPVGKRFYVAARDPDSFNGRWILLNTGQPVYVKDSQLDWDSLTVKP